MRILLTILFTIMLVGVLIVSVWHIAIPEENIQDLLENSINSENIIVKTDGIKKEILLSLRIEKLEINKKTNNLTLATLENIQIKPDFISLLKWNPLFYFSGRIYSGSLDGSYTVKEETIKIIGKDIKVEEIHFLKLFNIDGYGNLSFNADIRKSQGQIFFKVIDAKLKNTILPGGYFLPLSLFNGIKGLLEISNNNIEVKSFTLEGENIYARITGNIRGEVSDLKMELMPEKSFENRSLLFLIEPFKISPGYYVIPIHLKI